MSLTVLEKVGGLRSFFVVMLFFAFASHADHFRRKLYVAPPIHGELYNQNSGSFLSSLALQDQDIQHPLEIHLATLINNTRDVSETRRQENQENLEYFLKLGNGQVPS